MASLVLVPGWPSDLFTAIRSGITAYVSFAQGAGFFGAVLFGVLYAVAVPLMIPGSLLTLGAGLAYGPIGGFLVVWPSATLGATISFLLGKTTLRDRVQGWLAGTPKVAMVDEALSNEGGKILFLLRLSPVVPFGLLNYASGLSGLSLRTYLWATSLGMIPGTFLYVYLGSTLSSLEQAPDTQSTEAKLLYWGGLAATALASILATRVARNALKRQLPPQDS